MADFTEDELSNALSGGNDDVKPVGIAADLEEENKQEEPVEETPAEEPQPATEEEPAKEEPKDEPKEEPVEEPPTEQPEPKSEEEPAPQEPELILGKFKSQEDLVKAYQNLEKRFGEKAKEVKEVEQVKSDDFDKAVDQKIIEENTKIVEKALETITDPEKAKEAQYLWYQAQRTGNADFFEKARGFLDARVDRRLEADMMNTAAQIRMKANEHREEILLKPLSDELDKMVEEDPEFMNDEQNQNLMAMAIKLNPATVDVRFVKKAIKDYREKAYQKGYEAAKKEFAKQVEKKAVPIKSVAKIEQPAPKKNYDEMSIEEQLKEEYKEISLK